MDQMPRSRLWNLVLGSGTGTETGVEQTMGLLSAGYDRMSYLLIG
jgi:hypothetical protein